MIWTSRILLLFPQVILVPYLIHRLGDSGYGVYALVWSLIVAIEQLQRSLQSGVVKYSAGFLAQGRMDRVNGIFSSSFLYSILLALLASSGILISAKLYSSPSSEIISSLIVAAILVLFVFPITPYIAIIESQQRYYIGAIAETISKYIGLLLLVICFEFVEPSVLAVIFIMSIMMFIARLVQVPIAHRFIPDLRNRWKFIDRDSFHLIISFGAAIVLASLCLAVNSTGLRWLMASLVSTSFVAHMAIILMPGVLLSQIVSAATVTVMPAASAYEATGNQRMLQELLTRGMRYTTILVLSGILVATLLMRNVISVWVGPSYEFLSPYALALFISISFMLSTSTGHHMLKGMEKLKAVVIIYFLGLVFVPIGLILFLFRILGEPYLALAIGVAAGHFVCGCLQFIYSTRAVRSDLSNQFRWVYMQPVLVAAAVWLIVMGTIWAAGINGFAGRLGASFIAVPLFLSGCYALILKREERLQLKEFIQFVTGKFI
jgi:O-antigen/teichoic acid export membrane protein